MNLRLAMALVGMCEVVLLILSFRVPDDKYQRVNLNKNKGEEGYVTLEGNEALQAPLL